MFKKIVSVVLGDPNQKEINRLMPEVDEINALEAEMQGKSDEELRQIIADYRAHITAETREAREKLAQLEKEAVAAFGDERRRLELEVERAQKALLALEDDLLVEIRPQVFAAVREAGVRTIGQRHYDVQVVGSILLHQGKAVGAERSGRPWGAPGYAQRLPLQGWDPNDGADLSFAGDQCGGYSKCRWRGGRSGLIPV
jgi:preprotein translocase subunit SecA